MIRYRDERIAILDEPAFHRNTYKTLGWEYDPRLFLIHAPFKMDSQWEAETQRPDRRIRRKRKRPHAAHLQEHIAFVRALASDVRRTGQERGIFTPLPQADGTVLDNNIAARAAVRQLFPVPSEDKKKEEQGRRQQPDDIMGFPSSSVELRNQDDNNAVLVEGARKGGGKEDEEEEGEGAEEEGEEEEESLLLLPAGACAHAASVSAALRDAVSNDHFLRIFVDPPWQSRSVSRLQTYETNQTAARELPPLADRLAASDSDVPILALWLTNSPAADAEARHLLSIWKLEQVARWYWLKTTIFGDPVYELDDVGHKLPFEQLILATVPGRRDEAEKRLPKRYLFASVPMAVHSHKPPLGPLLDAFLGDPDPKHRFLELFARSLLPRTVSIGLEVFHLQHRRLFQAVPVHRDDDLDEKNECSENPLPNDKTHTGETESDGGQVH